MSKPFTPNLRTPPEDFSAEEVNKLNSNGIRGNLAQELRDNNKPDLAWEAEQLAKSYGIYMEFNRAHTGTEKDWMFMIRITIPGGGPLNRAQWLALDELADKYTVNPQNRPSLRLTTRQNLQFHWVKKAALLDIIRTLATKDLLTLNGCGDNTRNVMACPLSRHSDIFDATALARRTADYFQLPLDPFIEIFAIDPNYLRHPEDSFKYSPNLLNRKFKIAISAVHHDPLTGKLIPDNCVELLTNDMAVAPVIENGKVSKFQIYIGGGQGERNGKPSLATLAQPFTVVPENQLFAVMDAIVAVHQEWGDRQNRFWARLKYVVKKMGIDWYRQQVSARVGFALPPADPVHDYGARHLHFGWSRQPDNGLWSFGCFIENGRLIDGGPNGDLKTMVREMMTQFSPELLLTPNQDLLFTNIPAEAKADFEIRLKSFGWGQRHGKTYSNLRLNSGACVGRDTCRLTYTDSEKFEPFLIDELENMGWGDCQESIGVTGCERQCFRPATKTIGLVGTGVDRYQFKLFGDETGRFQGKPLMMPNHDEIYLRSVPRDKVAVVIDALFKFHQAQALPQENLGAFLRRIGPEALIVTLKENPATSELMTKPISSDCILE